MRDSDTKNGDGRRRQKMNGKLHCDTYAERKTRETERSVRKDEKNDNRNLGEGGRRGAQKWEHGGAPPTGDKVV